MVGVGRPATPVALKVLEGNPGKRALPKPPKFSPLSDEPPVWLAREGRAEWRRLMREFDRVDLAKRPDRGAMVALCETWATYVDACKDVESTGLLVEETTVYRGKTTKRKAKNPSVVVARDALAQLIQLWARFGMTPADRARLDMPEVPADDDPMLRLLT